MGYLLIGSLVGVVLTAVFAARSANRNIDEFQATVDEYQAGIDRLIELHENQVEPPWEVS